ncbi:hypothetical protein D3C77_405190 [compost metagenome]
MKAHRHPGMRQTRYSFLKVLTLEANYAYLLEFVQACLVDRVGAARLKGERKRSL